MISMQLLLYCLLLAGGYLLVISALLELLGKTMNVARGIPEDMRESLGMTWFILTFVIELMFFVVIPSLAFGFFHVILPLTSIRTALAVALCAFILGGLPVIMGLSVRVKLPITFLIFNQLGLLLKLGGSLAIIGYLYAL